MAVTRNALGRGLGALLPGSSAGKVPAMAPGVEPQFAAAPDPEPPFEIAVSEIDPNPEQPRRHLESAHLEELAGSIRRHGILQPVVVRRAGERFELVVGERRWRAAQQAGLEAIPAVVMDVSTHDRLELALVENVQRRDLNPVELGHAYKALGEAGATQEEIGQRVGLDRSSVANHMRLLELPREIQGDIEERRLSLGHAKALLQVQNPERRRHLRNRIVEGRLSVRESERLARDSAGPARRRKARAGESSTSGEAFGSLKETLEKHLQTRVRIHGDAKQGRIEIQYFSAEDLDRLGHLLLEGS